MPVPILPSRLSPKLIRSRALPGFFRIGGAGSRAPLLILAVTACLLPAAGCRRNSSPAIAPSNVAIRLSSLISLHPAWNDIKEIDTLIAHAKSLPSNQSAATTPIALPTVTQPAPLPARLDARPTSVPSIESARQTGLKRVNELQASMEEHNQDLVEREQKVLEKRQTTAVAAERARLAALPPEVIETPEQKTERAALRKLQFEQIALESEVKILTEPALTPVQQRLIALREQVRLAEARLHPPVQQVDVALEKAVAAFRQQKETETAATLKTRAEDLKTRSSTVINAYRGRLSARLADVKPLATAGVPAARPVQDIAIPSPAQAAATMPVTGGAVTTVSSNDLNQLLATRQRLVRFVTDDLRRRVDRIAAQRNWKVTYTAAPAPNDYTDRAAELLKQDFVRPGVTGSAQ
jgi:hypothetical protein